MTTEFSVKRITDALGAVDKARQEVDSAKATYKARRELLAEAQAALEDAIRAETSPVPLFDQPPTSEVSFTAEVGKALREGLAGTGVVLHENVGLSLGEQEAPKQWDGAATAPDAWRHQGVGLALRTLPLATVEKLGKAGLATVGALADHAGQAPGEMPAIKGLGAKATADVYAALDNHLEALREVHPDGDEDAE